MRFCARFSEFFVSIDSLKVWLRVEVYYWQPGERGKQIEKVESRVAGFCGISPIRFDF